MRDRVWDLVRRARRLEASLTTRVEGAARQLAGPPAARPPLETLHEIVDAIGREVQPVGRGRRALPFNAVKVTLAASGRRERAAWQAVLDAPHALEARILERLQTTGAATTDLVVRVSFSPQPGPDWPTPEFRIDFTRRAPAAGPKVPPAPTISLTVVEGTASERAYSFAATPVAIGRGAEVRDTRQRLVRTNHVAFLEGAGAANEGVSRRHAHLERDTSSGNWRVIDDGSSQGTEVVRNGRGIAVPRGTRGLGLQAGDEIVLGRARLRIGRT